MPGDVVLAADDVELELGVSGDVEEEVGLVEAVGLKLPLVVSVVVLCPGVRVLALPYVEAGAELAALLDGSELLTEGEAVALVEPLLLDGEL